MRMFSLLFSKIIGIIFPHRCVGCAHEGVLLCQPCSASLKPRSPACFICNTRNQTGKICQYCRKYTGFSHFYAPFAYAAKTPREFVHRLKYRLVTDCGALMASFITQGLNYYKIPIPKNTICVPVPLHSARYISRGFNQAELIARTLAETLKLPITNNQVLKRKRKTKPQVECGTSEKRLQNVANAFYVLDATPIFRRDVLLIDDVATTGATLTEATKALKRAGAKSVRAITFAK